MIASKPTILLVDDQPSNIRMLAEILKPHYNILIAISGIDGLKILKTTTPDLILLDIFMPNMDGFSFADKMHSIFSDKQIPIIFVSSAHDYESIQKSLNKGACDYILKPYDPKTLQIKIKKVLFKVEKSRFESSYIEGNKIMNTFFRGGVKSINHEMLYDWANNLIDIIMYAKDPLRAVLPCFENTYDDPSHNVKVAILSVILGRTLNLKNIQLQDLAISGILHDSGKAYLPKDILDKLTSLDPIEFERVKQHSRKSYEVAKELGIHKVQILNAILHHHEKLDGTGYPDELVGYEIPLLSQILSVCDIFDALTTDRTYRPHFTTYDALKMMKTDMHHQLNEQYVNNLIALL
ncbi:MAG: hypothetical protein A2525_00895 [Sulfurimonas sp. RIFOXYD12_FULL_36_11]|nr:MAG: hypothetical protein A2525_00895 [Sulfurimonas sp. RIFOXYD12_FULL_36_11]